jgi:hypothetical protein
MPSKKSRPAKKSALKKKLALKKKTTPGKKIASKKKPAPKKKAGSRHPSASPIVGIVAVGFKVVCDPDGVIGTFADRESANAAKDAHLAKKENQDHTVVVEGFQG